MLRYTVIILCVVVVGSRFVKEARPSFIDSKQASFVQELDSYDVIVPRVTDEDGQFVSHDLKDGHRHRVRKSNSPNIENLYFKVQINNTDVHLNVTLNDKFLSPGLVFETRGNSSDVRTHTFDQRRTDHHHCHYLGSIVSQPGSHVAISNCNGLRGYINTPNGQYLIEPVYGHDVTADARHPHIVYKRPIQQDDIDESHHPMSTRAEQIYRQIKGSPNDSRKRHTRSTSLERNIEVLVVADPLMVTYYQDRGDIELYILTVMNMVTGMYRDASIGNDINIILVRVILLKSDQENLTIQHNAIPTLRSFSNWQQSINMKGDEHPNHHDVAVLITRKDICAGSNRPCLTLGLANIAAMCDPNKSSNINDDTGLNVAFTIAHEIGHNLGMKHDGDNNDCTQSPTNALYIMSGTMPSSVAPLIWSPCSREYVTFFLDRGWGDCLLDTPSKHDFDYPDVPPGVMYDAEHQCRLRYGSSVSVCFPEDLCRTLWCFNGTCHTKMGGAAPGTKCGKNKWCMNGACVPMTERAVAIDGDWGTWSEWSSCSRTCGGGVSVMSRECDNPRPANGGEYCLGKREKYALCNTQPCRPGSKDFRELQCSSFNSKPFRGNYYQWVPYLQLKGKECSLVCKRKSRQRHIETLKDKVIDGTSCGAVEMNGICISGICQKVGCDNKIDSTAIEDQCGVCHGDGSTCKTIKSNITQHGVGYREVVVIPIGARNIRVYEVAASVNYLAIRGENGDYYLNGNWFIRHAGQYRAAGTIVVYKRRNNLEKVAAAGPLTEPLTIEVLMQQKNADLSVEYTIPKNSNESLEKTSQFSWIHEDWSPCSATCGGGEQIAEVLCEENLSGIVENFYCNQTTKPNRKQRECNTDNCPAMWWIGNWQSCTATCGKNGKRIRSVFCIRSFGYDEQMVIEDEECIKRGIFKPRYIEPCNLVECPIEPVWITGNWSECSVDCGVGTQTRIVICNTRRFCEDTEQPDSIRKCQVDCDRASDSSDTNGFYNDEEIIEDESELEFSNQQQSDIPVTFGEWEKLDRKSGKRQQHYLQKLVERNEKHPERKTEEDIVLVIDNAALKAPVDSDQRMEKHMLSSRKEEVEKMFKVVEHDKHTKQQNGSHAEAVWRMGEWKKCSVSCGEGMMERTVVCVNFATNETDDSCSKHDKPELVKTCTGPPCPTASDPSDLLETCTEDKLPPTQCKLLKSRGNCHYLQYQSKCCVTCGQR
ncbi:A disintegrin and metalloproteinase with thrombospondin motifs 6-like [Antedon mediterranea]|uniref:A disintegrin and metalloproteinase with thrombospondin motifs 6-like n=1 Tax=Antedon mediterranea TaxID=105859 RepID=UPI003AF682BA